MSGRPPMQHRPTMSAIRILLCFDNDKAFNIEVPTRYDPKHPRTEGFILSLLEEQFRQIIHNFKITGLPALLEQYGEPIPEELLQQLQQQLPQTIHENDGQQLESRSDQPPETKESE